MVRLRRSCLTISSQTLCAVYSPIEGVPGAAGRGCSEVSQGPRWPLGPICAMAFQPSTKLYPCDLCLQEHRYFKMMDSYRPQHKLPRGELDTRDKYKRVCVKCEVALREREWLLMSEEQKAENPNYASEVEVYKELKKTNRGQQWAATASSMRQAKEEIHAEERASGEASTGKRRKDMILHRSKQLAEAILQAFKAGNMFDALRDAGTRMEGREITDRQYEKLFNDCMNDPENMDKRRALDGIEENARHRVTTRP